MITVDSPDLIDHFLDFKRMLEDMICHTLDIYFPERFTVDKAIVFKFRTKEEKCLSLVLYAPFQYVAVFSNLEGEDWKKWSYHDSCWREDGVRRVLQKYADQIKGFDWIKPYKIEHLSVTEKGNFRKLINGAYNHD